jgi:hypothetical protein
MPGLPVNQEQSRLCSAAEKARAISYNLVSGLERQGPGVHGTYI